MKDEPPRGAVFLCLRDTASTACPGSVSTCPACQRRGFRVYVSCAAGPAACVSTCPACPRTDGVVSFGTIPGDGHSGTRTTATGPAAAALALQPRRRHSGTRTTPRHAADAPRLTETIVRRFTEAEPGRDCEAMPQAPADGLRQFAGPSFGVAQGLALEWGGAQRSEQGRATG